MKKSMFKVAKKVASLLLAAAFSVCAFGCGDKTLKDEITVCMPDGAPAMAFAEMMLNDTEKDGITYRVVNPSVIATKVNNADMSKNADICALPVIAASKLLGTGEKYQMLGTLTSGNLYVLTNKEEVITDFQTFGLDNLGHLIGKTVGVMKINEVPGMTFKSILNEYGVSWQELTNDGEAAADKINLKAITDATAIDPLNLAVDCYVVAEPAASVQIKKNGFVSVCSLTQLYYGGEAPEYGSGEAYIGYPQAVLVAKKSLIQENKEWLENFLSDVKDSSMALQSADKINGEKIVSAVTSHLEDTAYTTTLKAPMLTWETITRCGVSFAETSLCKGAVLTYLERIMAVNANATKMPLDAFFYMD